MAIKEKVKQYIAEPNAHEGGAESGFGDAATPSIPTAEVPGGENMGAPGLNVGQDGVDD